MLRKAFVIIVTIVWRVYKLPHLVPAILILAAITYEFIHGPIQEMCGIGGLQGWM
jgi:hypothetical protein